MKKTLLFLMGCFVALSASALTYNVTVPEGTNACYMAGSKTDWALVEMTCVDATHYTLDIADAAESDEYKYCSGPDWKYVEKDAAGNDVGNRTWSENDVVVSWALVYGGGVVSPEELTYNVTVPEGTNACYIAGDMNTWTFQAMDRVDATHYTITLDATRSHGYKYCSGPGWAYEELTSTGGPVSNRSYSENDVVERWASIYNPEVQPGSITFTVTVPAGTEKCYMVGSFQDWDTELAVAMTNNGDGTFTHTLDDIIDIQYKYWNGYAWEKREGNRSASVANTTMVVEEFSEWDIPAGVSTVQAIGMKVYAAKGMLYIDSEKAVSVPVYNAQGMLVKVVNAAAGINTVNLPKGLYIVNNVKTVVY